MTPERWHRVTEVFHAALACETEAREAFLQSACRADPDLRVEVDRLIAAHLSVEGPRGDNAPLEKHPMPARRLEPGTTVGPYRIEGFVGAGGMGEVYRAIDARLRRTVAIKVLAPELAANPDLRARFEREAHVLAALRHPHIAAIHGIEELDGVHALVLEYVDGQTLDDWIYSGNRSTADALRLAGQIAEALSAAHERGIVHRDLKPPNIKITPTGDVRLLDFGIAKLVPPVGAASGSAGGMGPTSTLTAAQTREGFVIGSPAYMSPEQARGQPIDRRTDIWAFGCVLYEMLARRRPFDADTRTDLLAKILERDPDWDALPVALPDAIRTLLSRCLAKDPAARLHDIADARLEIADALSPVSLGRGKTARRQHRALWIGLATAAAALAATATWMIGGFDRQAPSPPVEFGILLPDNHMVSLGLVVSPDGARLAAGVFGSTSQIYLHTFATSTTTAIPGTEGATFPFWSPDGRMLAFALGGNIRAMDVADGAQTIVCRLPANFAGGTWNREGLIVFAAGQKLFRVPAGGGTPEPLAIPEERGRARFPEFLPDQRHFIYTAPLAGGNVVMLASLDSPAVTQLASVDSDGTFVPPNYLLFMRGATLMALPLDLGRGVPAGDPVSVASNAAPGVLFARANISGSENVLAFGTARGGSSGRLPWFDRNGVAEGGELARPAIGEYLNPAISPDGRFVAVNYMDPSGNWDIWAIDVARNVSWRVTTDPARDSDPVWSADSREIAFVSNRNGAYGFYRKKVTGSDPESLLFSEPGPVDLILNDWSPDGRYMLYSRSSDGRRSIWALLLTENAGPVAVIGDRGQPYAPRLSPNGQWIAYTSFDSGASEVYVERFLTPGQRQQISHGGGTHPRWTRNGGEIVYWAVPNGINAVDFVSSGSSFSIGRVRQLLQSPVLSLIDARTHYDVTRDGARLLVRQRAGSQGDGIGVVLNWAERLRRPQ